MTSQSTLALDTGTHRRAGRRRKPAVENGVISASFTRRSPEGSSTDVPDRSSLVKHLTESMQRARHTGQQLAVMFIDLDGFRSINDSHGHEMGDLMLSAVARRLRSAAPAEGRVIRMGGDEFAVILEDVLNDDQVGTAATRLRAVLAEPFAINGRRLMTTASIGVSVFPRDGASARRLLLNADAALYHSKHRGRNNCQIFRAQMGRRLREKTTLENRLRGAIRDGELDVCYQPIVEIKTLRVIALESLLRWRRPTGEWIAPDRFIGLAEETGLIVPIGEFVLERVLSDAVRWRETGCALVPIALNISALQLQRSNLHDLIVDGTRSAGLDPAILQVELTERAMFEGYEGTHAGLDEDVFARLRERGVHISIDDFGTGYSSLSYLKRWRVDSLKIDRSFVRDLVASPDDRTIVSAICTIARRFEIAVVAEGVEDRQQLAILRELGCAFAQGYLFSRPVAADRCAHYLSSAVCAPAWPY
jgi:diguanylate cyclase (GGDEF)-like protein